MSEDQKIEAEEHQADSQEVVEEPTPFIAWGPIGRQHPHCHWLDHRKRKKTKRPYGEPLRPYEDRVLITQWIIAGTGIALAVISMVSGILTYKMADRTIKASRRPAVIVSKFKLPRIEFIPELEPRLQRQIFWDLTYRNDGPGTAMYTIQDLAFSLTSVVADRVIRGRPDEQWLAVSPRTPIKSGATIGISGGGARPDLDLEAFLNGSQRLLLNAHAILYYRDEFNEPHYTSLCLSFTNDGSYSACRDPEANTIQ